MEQLTITNIALLLCGIALKFLFTLLGIKKEKKHFSLGFFIKDNWIVIAITIIGGFASLLMADDLVTYLGVYSTTGAPFFKIHAFLSGFLPMVILSKIQKLLIPDEKP